MRRSTWLRNAAFMRQRRIVSCALLHSSVSTPEEHGPDGLEDKVGQPENQMRREFRPRLQRLADDDEAVVKEREDECHGHAGARFTPVRANAERDANEREANASKGKGDLPMDLHAHGHREVGRHYRQAALLFAQFLRRGALYRLVLEAQSLQITQFLAVLT